MSTKKKSVVSFDYLEESEEAKELLFRLVDPNESPDEAVARMDDHRMAAEKAIRDLRVFFGREVRTREQIEKLVLERDELEDYISKEKSVLMETRCEKSACMDQLWKLREDLKEISEIQDVCRAEYKTTATIYHAWIEYLHDAVKLEKIYKAQKDHGEDWSI